MMAWNEAWKVFGGDLRIRPQQQFLGQAIFNITENGGKLIAEASTGVGKSYAYLVPLIYAARRKERSVISTETNALLDQLVDKDVPFLASKFGAVKYAALKGRTHYLCKYRAPSQSWIALKLGNKPVGEGQRRDIERILGMHVEDEDWEEVSGEANWCAQNKCQPEGCYSTQARARAAKADIVVTNHAMVRTDADMREMTDDGLLGDFSHLVIDEAHTLEKALVDGWSDSATPYELYKAMESIWEAVDKANVSPVGAQQAETAFKHGKDLVISFFHEHAKHRNPDLTDYEWKRESFTLSQKWLSGGISEKLKDALLRYENTSPVHFQEAEEKFKHLAEKLADEAEFAETGKRKIRKGATAAKRLAHLSGMLRRSIGTRDGIVMRYGVPYAVIGDGWKAYKGANDVRLRAVPLDVSKACQGLIWKGRKSVILTSATLSDSSKGDFHYTKMSLGIEDAEQSVVDSPFDHATQQLVYLTPRKLPTEQIAGAQFSMDELTQLIGAAEGRTMVLFTARSEMNHVAEYLRVPYQLLVQNVGANKQELVDKFTSDTSSVLLATKSFFTGVDFPGETLSQVILVKYPLPQYNALCRAQIDWWKQRGYPTWYDREGTLVFRQAAGRLIRTETDRGVVALLDQREGLHRKVRTLLSGSPATQDVGEVRKWLS